MPAKDKKLQQQNRVLAGLQETVTDMIVELDLQVILQKAVKRTAALVEADIVTIHIYDPLTVRVRAAAGYGLWDEETFQQHEPGRGKVALLVVNKGEPMIAEDVSTSELAGPFTAREGVQSAAGFPLKVGDKVIGVLFVNYREPHKFEPEEVETLISFGNLAAVAIGNANLIEQERQRADAMDLLQQVSAKISAPLDVEETLALIIEGAMRLTGTESGVIHLVDEAKQTVIRSYEVPEGFGHLPPRFSQEKGMTWTAVSTGRTIAVSDITKDERVNPAMAEKGVRAIIGTPLKVQDRTIGVLFLNDSDPHEFTEYEKELLSTLASHAAIAIQNANLTQHSHEVSRLALTGDYDKLADYVAEAVNDLTAASVTLWMLDEKENILRIQAGRGLRREYMENAITPVEPGRSITSLALRDRCPVSRRDILDETEEPHFYNMEEAIRQGWRSFLSVPLLGQAGQPLGALSIYYTEPRDFSEPETALLWTFANQAAIAFENVQTMQKLNTQLESLHRVVQEESLEEVLEQILEGINTILGEGTSSSINLHDEASDSFGPSTAVGPLADLLRVPPRAKSGTGRHVLETREAYYLDDVTKPPSSCPTIRDALAEQNPIKSFAALPLKRQDRIVGVLFVNLQVPISFSAGVRRVLELFASQAAVAIENARLFRELEDRAERLVRLQEVTTAVSAEPSDLTTLLRSIVDSLREIFRGASCAIRLYDSREDEFGPRVAVGPVEGLVDHPLRREGTSRYVVQTREPLYIEDVSVTPPDGVPTLRPEVLKLGIKAAAYLPLVSERGVIGILYMDLTEPRYFSQYDKQILELFANQAAIAIENARLLRDLDERATQLLQLQEVTAAISAEPSDLEKVLRLIVESLGHIFREIPCAIRLYDSQRDEFGRRVARGDLSEQLVFDPRPDGATRHVLKTKTPLYAEDTSVKLPDGKSVIRRELEEQGLRAVAYLPLLIRDDVVGMLYLNLTNPYRFSRNDKQILELFASQAAIAVENARLFQELDERSSRLVRLQEVTATISTETSDLEKVLHLVVDSLSKIFWKAPCAIRPYDSTTATFGDRVSTGGLTDQLVFTPRPDGASWHVVNTKIPLYVENPSVTLPDGQPAIREELAEKGVRAIAYLPLISKENVIGILYVNLTEPHRFSEDDKQILELFANQAAIAIENAQLYGQSRALFSAMRDVVLVYDRQGRYLDVVPTSAPELLYKPAAEMIGKPVHEVLPKPAADRCLEAIRRSLDNQDTVSTEYNLDIRGSETWFEARVSPMLRISPILEDKVIFVARDITARRKELAALQDINEAVVSKKRDEILQLIVDKAVEVMPGEYSELWLKEAATGDLVLQAVAGPESARETALRIGRLKAGEASTNMRVARTGEPYIWKGEEEDPDFRRIYEAAQSAVIVPLKYQGGVIGTLNVESSQPEAFTDRHSRLLGSFSDGAAIAIKNAQVVQGLQVLTETGRTVSNLGIDQILDLVYEKAVKIMDLSNAQVQIAFYNGAKEEVSFPLAVEQDEGKTIDIVRWSERLVKYRRPVFGVQLELQSALEQGIVSKALLRQFEGHGNQLPDDISVTEREEGHLLWLREDNKPLYFVGKDEILEVYTSEGEFLFCLELILLDALEAGLSSKALRQRFEDNKIPLPDDLSITTDEKGCLWTIEGGEQKYTVAKVEKLGVYKYEEIEVKEFQPRVRRDPPGLNEYVIRTKEPLLIVEDFERKAIKQGIKVWPTFGRLDRHTYSWLGVPMMVADRVIGVISIQSLEQERAFDEGQQELLATVASQAAGAIENARLYQDLDRRVKELEVLNKIGQTVSTLGTDEILNLVYEEMGKVIDLSDAQVQIAFHDEVKDEVSFPLAVEQDRGELIDRVRWSKREEEYRKPGEDEVVEQFKSRARRDPPGLNEYVIRTKEPLLITGDPDRNFEQKATDLGIKVWPTFGRLDRPTHSWLGVPMMVRGRVIGVISIQSLEQERAFDEGQQELLETVAYQAAVAIENARLYEQLRIELSTTEKQQEALRSLLSVNQIAGRFVHRISQLAGTVPIDIQFIQDKIDPKSPIYEDLEEIRTQVQQMLGMVQRIRDSALKLEESQYLQQVEASELMERALAEIRGGERIPSWGRKIAVVQDYQDQPLIIETFEPLFVEALGALISNAIEAMSQGGTLTLRTERRVIADAECAVLTVADTGVGIPTEDLERIFSMGYSTKPHGFGYGLWLVKQICDATGTQVEADSKEGVGSTFHIMVPLVR